MPCAIGVDSTLILWISAPFYTLLLQGDVVHAHPEANGVFRIGVHLTDVIEGNWDHLKRDVLMRLEDELE